MTTVHVEKNFCKVFERYPAYFYDRIKSKWPYILHEDETHFYIDSLVREFYDSFSLNDIDMENLLLHVNLKGRSTVFGINEISEWIGIRVKRGVQRTDNIAFYRPLMGPNCTESGMSGLIGHTLYRNVYAAARMLCENVTPTSHVTNIYIPTLHILHMIMTKSRYFCMVRHLFKTIVGVKIDNSPILVLPCLVTLICSKILTEAEFLQYHDQHILIKKIRVSAPFHAAVQIDWTPSTAVEDVRTERVEQVDDDAYFSGPIPVSEDDRAAYTAEGVRRVYHRLSRLERFVRGLARTFACGYRAPSGGRQPVRPRGFTRSHSTASDRGTTSRRAPGVQRSRSRARATDEPAAGVESIERSIVPYIPISFDQPGTSMPAADDPMDDEPSFQEPVSEAFPVSSYSEQRWYGDPWSHFTGHGDPGASSSRQDWGEW